VISRPRRIGRRLAAGAIAAAVALSLTACVAEPSEGEAQRDPAPSFADARTTQVDAEGARWSAAGVAIDVPGGAVRTNVANVTVGARIGEADSGIAREVFGTPVRLESAGAFADPITVTWDLSTLPAEAAASASLVRWDPDLRVWAPEPGAVVEGGRLTAGITQPGTVAWAAASVQNATAPTPAADLPACGDAELPGWVATYADPDAERPESAITACVETHRSDVLTVRTRSRDDVPRALTLTGEAAFDWVTRERGGSRFWALAATLVDDERTALLPPGGGVDVGLSEPDGGAHRAVARVDVRTAALDLLAAFARRVSLGEVPDASTTGLLSHLFRCATAGGGEVQDTSAVAALGAALTTCAQQVPGAGEASTAAEVQGRRAAEAAARIGASGAFEELAEARSEALVAAAAAPAGGASWTVLGGSDPAVLGAWEPTCDDAEADAAALFANLAGAPEFAGTDGSLATHPGWPTATVAAVAPFASCSPDDRARFAAQLPDQWADPEAARLAVDALAGLGLSLLSCDDIYELAAPLAEGFHGLRGITASGTGRVACGWASERGKAVTDPGIRSRVQVWVSRESADAEEVAQRRSEAEKTELGGVQRSDILDAAGGFVVGAYVPTGLELESWLPGYRIVVTTTSADDPAQWRMREGVEAVERIAAALTAD